MIYQKDPGPNEFGWTPRRKGMNIGPFQGWTHSIRASPYRRMNRRLCCQDTRAFTITGLTETSQIGASTHSTIRRRPTGNFNDGPVFQTGSDAFGAFFDVKLTATPNDLGFIVHNVSTGTKDPGPDMHLAVNTFKEAWVISGDATVYTSLPSEGQILSAGNSRLQAFWIDRSTIAVPAANIQNGWALALVYSPNASLQITSTFGLTGGTSIPLTALASGLTA